MPSRAAPEGGAADGELRASRRGRAGADRPPEKRSGPRLGAAARPGRRRAGSGAIRGRIFSPVLELDVRISEGKESSARTWPAFCAVGRASPGRSRTGVGREQEPTSAINGRLVKAIQSHSAVMSRSAFTKRHRSRLPWIGPRRCSPAALDQRRVGSPVDGDGVVAADGEAPAAAGAAGRSRWRSPQGPSADRLLGAPAAARAERLQWLETTVGFTEQCCRRLPLRLAQPIPRFFTHRRRRRAGARWRVRRRRAHAEHDVRAIGPRGRARPGFPTERLRVAEQPVGHDDGAADPLEGEAVGVVEREWSMAF